MPRRFRHRQPGLLRWGHGDCRRFEDGLVGDATTLFSKSILDGVTAVIFAAGMGMGVALSALPVLVYQGSITLLAGVLRPFLTGTVIQQMSLVGGILIFAIGLNL